MGCIQSKGCCKKKARNKRKKRNRVPNKETESLCGQDDVTHITDNPDEAQTLILAEENAANVVKPTTVAERFQESSDKADTNLQVPYTTSSHQEPGKGFGNKVGDIELPVKGLLQDDGHGPDTRYINNVEKRVSSDKPAIDGQVDANGIKTVGLTTVHESTTVIVAESDKTERYGEGPEQEVSSTNETNEGSDQYKDHVNAKNEVTHSVSISEYTCSIKTTHSADSYIHEEEIDLGDNIESQFEQYVFEKIKPVKPQPDEDEADIESPETPVIPIRIVNDWQDDYTDLIYTNTPLDNDKEVGEHTQSFITESQRSIGDETKAKSISKDSNSDDESMIDLIVREFSRDTSIASYNASKDECTCSEEKNSTEGDVACAIKGSEKGISCGRNSCVSEIVLQKLVDCGDGEKKNLAPFGKVDNCNDTDGPTTETVFCEKANSQENALDTENDDEEDAYDTVDGTNDKGDSDHDPDDVSDVSSNDYSDFDLQEDEEIELLPGDYIEKAALCDECLKVLKFSRVTADAECFTCEMYLCSNCIKNHHNHSYYIRSNDPTGKNLTFEDHEDEGFDMILDELMNETDKSEKLLCEKQTLCARINIKHPKDIKDCWIRDLAVLQNGEIVLTDSDNNCIKLVDKNHNIVRRIELTAWACGIVEIIEDTKSVADNNQQNHESSGNVLKATEDIAQTQPDSTNTKQQKKTCFIAFTCPTKMCINTLDITNNPAQIVSTIDVGKECFNLLFHNDVFMTVCIGTPPTIHFISKVGEPIKVVELFNGEVPPVRLKDWYPRIVLHPESETIYVSSYDDNTLLRITSDGEVLDSMIKDDLLPYGIAVDKDENVFMCSEFENCTYKISKNLDTCEKLVGDSVCAITQPAVLELHENKLFITSDSEDLPNTITVIKLE